NAMMALEPIGLSGKVARLAVAVARQGLRRSDGTWLMSFPGDLMVQRWGAAFVVVHRAELQQLLAAELDPSAIHLAARGTGVGDGDRAVIARFADGGEVRLMSWSAPMACTRPCGPLCSGLLRSGTAATSRCGASRSRDQFRFPATVPRPGAGARASA